MSVEYGVEYGDRHTDHLEITSYLPDPTARPGFYIVTRGVLGSVAAAANEL